MDMKMNKKAIAIAASAVGGTVTVALIAAWIYNSRRLKTARALKRASKIMYYVGTVMRNISDEGTLL